MINCNRKRYKLICSYCKKDFEQTSKGYRKEAKYRYCSKECSNKHKRKINYYKMCSIVKGDFKDWLIEQYWGKELPTRDIAKLVYGKSQNSPNILGWMKKLDIPTRSRTDAVALQWKDNYQRRLTQSMDAQERFSIGTPAREKLIKVMQSKEYRLKQSISKSGEKNGMWNANLSKEERENNLKRNRLIPGYNLFRWSVYERDEYTCQKCGDNSGGNLVVHHINSYKEHPDLRVNKDNGVTLCESCHKEYHKTYGRNGANKKDFNEYLNKALVK